MPHPAAVVVLPFLRGISKYAIVMMRTHLPESIERCTHPATGGAIMYATCQQSGSNRWPANRPLVWRSCRNAAITLSTRAGSNRHPGSPAAPAS